MEDAAKTAGQTCAAFEMQVELADNTTPNSTQHSLDA